MESSRGGKCVEHNGLRIYMTLFREAGIVQYPRFFDNESHHVALITQLFEASINTPCCAAIRCNLLDGAGFALCPERCFAGLVRHGTEA